MRETMNCRVDERKRPWTGDRALHVEPVPDTHRRVQLTLGDGPSFSVNVQELIETIQRVLPIERVGCGAPHPYGICPVCHRGHGVVVFRREAGARKESNDLALQHG